MTKKIGIVTGGGDCPGLNTDIRAVAKAATMRGRETFGVIFLAVAVFGCLATGDHHCNELLQNFPG